VSSLLPSREQAIELLRQIKCPLQVIRHCIGVAGLAVETADQLQANGYEIDVELVEAGALLHDLGRSKCHSVDHAIIGADIARSLDLPESVINIIKRHVGAGISEDEAAKLGWPKDNYIPQTLEEKVVCYADKLIEHGKKMPIETEIKKLQKENKFEAAERVRKLYQEISSYLSNQP
jgi:uncharacterized protein